MLFQLNIKNMALIKELNIEFEEGLNVLTGETGAGKSIIIEAIDLILGGSTATDLIRDGEDRLVVEGLFLLVPQEKELISNLNLDAEIVDGEEDLLIRREINKKGRNKCWINQRLINLSTLQEIGKFLVDLHGQHNHQSLLDSSKHIDLMDNLGGDKIIKYRKELADNYRMWREKSKKLFQLIKDGEENSKRIDFLKFQLEEIRENLKEIGYQFEDIVNEIVKYKDEIDLDSQKLKEVEGRLNLINSLKSKYGSTVEEILEYRQKIYQELEAVDYSEDKLEKLKEEVNSLEDIISTISHHLNINRLSLIHI